MKREILMFGPRGARSSDMAQMVKMYGYINSLKEETVRRIAPKSSVLDSGFFVQSFEVSSDTEYVVVGFVYPELLLAQAMHIVDKGGRVRLVLDLIHVLGGLQVSVEESFATLFGPDSITTLEILCKE